ncbi:MAG: hypothetical protein ACR2MA_09185 [Egibacteraceae bacterium]
MALLISTDTGFALRLASAWAAAGDDVTAVLCDRAAATARTGHPVRPAIDEAGKAGVQVVVHDEALDRHAVGGGTGLPRLDLEELATLVSERAERVVWW